MERQGNLMRAMSSPYCSEEWGWDRASKAIWVSSLLCCGCAGEVRASHCHPLSVSCWDESHTLCTLRFLGQNSSWKCKLCLVIVGIWSAKAFCASRCGSLPWMNLWPGPQLEFYFLPGDFSCLDYVGEEQWNSWEGGDPHNENGHFRMHSAQPMWHMVTLSDAVSIDRLCASQWTAWSWLEFGFHKHCQACGLDLF